MASTPQRAMVDRFPAVLPVGERYFAIVTAGPEPSTTPTSAARCIADVNPANVVLTSQEDQRILLADFGIVAPPIRRPNRRRGRR